jgi:hypothetical protein
MEVVDIFIQGQKALATTQCLTQCKIDFAKWGVQVRKDSDHN